MKKIKFKLITQIPNYHIFFCNFLASVSVQNRQNPTILMNPAPPLNNLNYQDDSDNEENALTSMYYHNSTDNFSPSSLHRDILFDQYGREIQHTKITRPEDLDLVATGPDIHSRSAKVNYIYS